MRGAAPLEETISIVGVGLIGGSIAAAVKRHGLARRVLGIGRNAERLAAAQQSGLIDAWSTDDVPAPFIIYCTPVDQIADGVRRLTRVGLPPDTVLTDVGSVKQPICDALCDGLPRGVEFVGAHPIAGSEKTGFEFAEPDLFEGRVCVVTPCPHNSPAAVERVTRFWQALGARVVTTSPEAHDLALAETSHLPHLIAAVLASTLQPDHRGFTGSGFRDTTRIAAGDPGLWTAILLQNQAAVLASLDRFTGIVEDFRGALEAGDADCLCRLLEEGRLARAAVPGLGAASVPEKRGDAETRGRGE